MKNITKQLIALFLCIILFFNNSISVCAKMPIDVPIPKDPNNPTQEELDALADYLYGDTDRWKKTENIWWTYILSQTGALWHGDLEQIKDNDLYRQKLLDETWRKENMQVRSGEDGKPEIVIRKSVSDAMINILKESTKKTDNGGYELVKTVPASKISSLYFPSPARYTTFKNLLKDNGGIIGLQIYGGYKMCFYKVRSDVFWVGQADWNFNDSGGNHKFYKACGYENTVSSVQNYWCYDLPGAEPAKSWDDTDNLAMNTNGYWSTTHFGFYDAFSYLAESKSESNPLIRRTFLVTASGASVPVFNTVSDAVAYSVANNLYYTSSDYTGEGKEIIIPLDEIDKILNGYYNGMYDLLQQLIEQNGGNALTPEQLQKLVDEVKASFGMIQDSINAGFEQQDILIQKNSEIMQNIADALNAFFSQSKEFRNTFIKSFNDYAKSEKERDEMLYRLLSDYLDGKKDNPDSGENTGGDETEENFLQKIYDMVKNGFDDVVKELKKIKHWNALDTVLDGAGAVGEWVTFLTDLLDPEKGLDTLTDFVKEGTVALDGMTELVDGKFPFCIPIDILLLMETLSAEPEAPKFEIPFVLERYGIDEKITIDLKDFQVVSDISRTFLTILWCCSLMNFTTKITDMKSI